jgi:hypothetical protein
MSHFIHNFYLVKSDFHAAQATFQATREKKKRRKKYKDTQGIYTAADALTSIDNFRYHTGTTKHNPSGWLGKQQRAVY